MMEEKRTISYMCAMNSTAALNYVSNAT
uniref:Uncharacterized protein n=1 Tax=Rhizophora mucronata TaxID=61149 RepID=A0A2P2PL48_RHIMU